MVMTVDAGTACRNRMGLAETKGAGFDVTEGRGRVKA